MSNIDYAANFESFLKTTNREQPFCFWMGTFEPHRGYTKGLASYKGTDCSRVTVPAFLPKSKEVNQDICEYYAEIEHIDDQVGELIQVLKRQDQLENTLIMVTSDNGMPFPRAKATLYDYGTRMPLIVWWGKKIKAGRRVTDLVSLTDIAPTFLETAGINKPWDMSGTSLLPILLSAESGQIDSSRNKVYMYRERHGFYPNSHGRTTPARAVRTNEYLLIWNFNSDSLTRDVDGGPTKTFMDKHKAAYPELYDLSFAKRPEFELYNVKIDTFQLSNLAYDPDYAKVFTSLQLMLVDYLTERKDPRLTGDSDAFLYNPYFGIAFQEGLLKWTPEQQGQDLSFEERRKLLQKAYGMMGEIDFFKEMIKRQKGKL
jgi:uncharacterized sulfatase